MTELVLAPKQRQTLKGQAHRLSPVVLLGAAGLSEAVIKETDRALAAHGLIKVRVPGDDRAERDFIAATLATRLACARVGSVGKVLILFRPLADSAGGDASLPEAAGRPPQGAAARSPKAPARGPRTPEKAAGAGRGKPERSEIRRVNRTTAPRRPPAGRAR